MGIADYAAPISRDVVRIGCGGGFWGDSTEGPKQLVDSGEIDYLVLDYLAEITMSLLARAHAKDPATGYATEFPSVLAEVAPTIRDQHIKVVTNAGGINPHACKAAIEAKLEVLNIDLKVAVVTGDDLLPRAAEFADVKDMFTGETMPAKLLSMNAYLGAFPIAQALTDGADVVVTGRCVDSAVVLGPLIHEFGWQAGDYDLLSAGSLAGHIVECGTQATGGITTDWNEVSEDWDRMGFPIAVCKSDGSFIVTKPSNTGGRVTPETTAEQIVYEIGDPSAYLLPDVTCDWRDVQLRLVGEHRVEVTGAKGTAPSADYKVTATYQDGFRCTATMMIGGVDAFAKANAVAAAILKRTRRMLAKSGLDDYQSTNVEVLGAEANWGAHARRYDTREVILKIAAHHADRRALEILSRECFPPAAAMAQGITGFFGGRPKPTPLVRLFSCLIPKNTVSIRVDGGEFESPAISSDARREAQRPEPESAPVFTGPMQRVRLIDIAYGRSGDKGDAANIGVLARRPEFVAVLRAQLTADAVRTFFAHFTEGEVTRFEIPGLQGFNFLLQSALGGGGTASLRYDPQGKMFAQILMDFPIDVPVALLDEGR